MNYDEFWITTSHGNFYPGECCYAITTNGRAVGRHPVEVIEIRFLGVFSGTGNAAIEYLDAETGNYVRTNNFGHLKLNRLRKKPVA